MTRTGEPHQGATTDRGNQEGRRSRNTKKGGARVGYVLGVWSLTGNCGWSHLMCPPLLRFFSSLSLSIHRLPPLDTHTQRHMHGLRESRFLCLLVQKTTTQPKKSNHDVLCRLARRASRVLERMSFLVFTFC